MSHSVEKTLTVVFDGEVFRPTEPIDIEPNTNYVITIRREVPSAVKAESAWDVLDKYSGSVEGPGDLSTELDHYLYGTPKRRPESP